MRDCMDRTVTPSKRVTSTTWGPPPPCKQALKDTVEPPDSDCPKCKIYTSHLQEVVAYENRTNKVS